MNANEIEQNGSIKTNICADTNANKQLPINRGAIPKRVQVNTKLNNNIGNRSCCLKMGLGNGNDTNIDLLNKVQKHPLIKADDVENAVNSVQDNYLRKNCGKNVDSVAAGSSGCDRFNETSSSLITRKSSTSSLASNSTDSTDSESDDTSLSISDDGCVYTYKGDNNTEEYPLLPHIEPPLPLQEPPPPRDSSPEMDYLEMDFDPGPSNETDFEISPIYPPQVKIEDTPSTSTGIRHYYNQESDSEETPEVKLEVSQADQLLYKDCMEQSLAYSIFYHDSRPLTPLMFWDEKDAAQKQFNLLYAGCVTNAVLNALLELEKIPSRIIPEWANQYLLAQNPKEEELDLIQFLVGRSHSIPSHEDLVVGLKTVSNGTVFTRFFATYPERNFSLSHWLKYWLEHNVIPIVTFNQQVFNKELNSPTTPVPEWQHHTVFGVTTSGIYLTDPIQCASEDILRKKLTSDSILLVKRSEVLSRWNKTTDLGPLYNKTELEWKQVNTLGKLVHMLRDMKTPEKSGGCQFLPVPISVRAGITLVSCVDNPACDLIEHCPELPLKNTA